MSIPERLVRIREKNGYTRKRLADELGKPYTTITKYETGEREPGHEYIIEIAKKFGVSTDYILGLIDEPEDKKSSSFTGEEPINEEAAEIGAQLYKMLIDAGWVKEGEDITNKQQRILQVIVDLIYAEFN